MRPALGDLLVHRLDVVRTFRGQPDQTVPTRGLRARRLHAPPEQREELDRQQRRLVAPVLEQLAVLDHAGEQVAPVRAEPREERQLLRAHDDVDRVDLDQPDPAEHPAHVAPVDAAQSDGHAESLRTQRDAARRGRPKAPPRSRLRSSE